MKSFKGEKVEDLAEFLEEKLGIDVKTGGSELVLDFKEEDFVVKRSYLREVLRKFLHRAELKDDFRVISGGENAFIIKEKRKRE